MKKISKLIFILFIIILLGGCLGSLINDKTSKPSYDDKTNTPIINEVNFSSMSMACIGDSITWGYEGNLNTPMSNTLPKLIKKSLNFKNVDNYGICGSTLSTSVEDDMWVRIENLNKHYDVIYVFGGVNDLNLNCPLGDINSFDTNTIYGALNTIANTLKNNYPNSFIFFITPLKCHREDLSYTFPNAVGVNLYDIANAIKEVGKLNDIPVLDLYNLSPFDPLVDSYNNDGVHPTYEFLNKSIAPQIVQFIKENYKK